MEILLVVGLVLYVLGRRRAKRSAATAALGQVLDVETKRTGRGRWKVGEEWL